MGLLTIEQSDAEIQTLDTVLSEPEKDKNGVVKKDKNGQAKPNPISGGLNEWQISQLKETVVQIRTVDGHTKLFAAKKLYDLRGLIRGSKKGENPKQWTAFKKSGLVPFSSREIQDLCASYEWLKDSGLDGAMLNTVGIRTLALIATTSNKAAQAKLTAALMAGEQVTRNRASLMSNPPSPKKVQPTYETKIVALNQRLPKWDTAKLRGEYTTLFEKNFKLEEEVKELKAQLAAARG